MRYSILIFLVLFFSCGGNDDSEIQITVSTKDFSITIDENPFANAIIGAINGSTNQGNVMFSIKSQTPDNSLNIDQLTGELSVNNVNNFDYEINPIITGIVDVSNGDISKSSIVTITLNNLNEPKIFDGNIQFDSQEDVNNFGSAKYTEVTGFIDFNGFNIDITTLAPLENLTKIGGDLLIRDCNKLTNLNGLQNLSFVGGNIAIGLNDQLVSIEALKNIKNTIGDLRITDNDLLTSLEGLNNLVTVGDWFKISNNDKLIDISALKSLISIEGDFTIQGINLFSTLEGLNNLNSIGGEFEIFGTLLTNLNGLENLNYIKGGLIVISSNANLINLNGLDSNPFLSSTYDTSFIRIEENLSLANIDGLSKFTFNDDIGLIINVNPSLININGLTSINKCIGIEIAGNSALKNIDGLMNINTISGNGNLKLESNTLLNDLCGIKPLIENNGIEGNYIVSDNSFNPSEQDILDGNCKN